MISLKDIDLQRPGTGISPNYLNKIINRRIKKNLNSGEVLKWNLIK
jgi:sialic acid synthase SpsE